MRKQIALGIILLLCVFGAGCITDSNLPSPVDGKKLLQTEIIRWRVQFIISENLKTALLTTPDRKKVTMYHDY